ncbi:hypothetical protein [Agrococcus jejuensis]|uniref:Uncharacterized protein n=1 Tax=Agrococcus jejuensis TaxID=399736 RepID=A0A1G8FT05_9MICO|nr:hypothetical protein [Agrococcus jejuensis]SDH85298.1 hypothetical protein SAMN04489720_2607 [Agrococcus jejuensis]
MTDRAETNEPEGAEVVEPETPVADDVETDVDEVDEPRDAADEQAEDDESTERVERRSDVVIVMAVFVVLFGYQLYAAVSNLIGLPEVYAAAGITDAVPWAILVANVAAPAVAFAAASAVARGRRLAARAGILLLGFGVSAQLSLLCEELARQAAIAAFSH